MRVNGVACDDFSGSVRDLLAHRAVPERGVAVALNGEVVPRSRWDAVIVGPDDSVEIVTAAAGG